MERDIVMEEIEDDSALPPAPSDDNADNGASLPPTVAEYEKHWDPNHESWYFMNTHTNESYWCAEHFEGDDGLWMEVFDETTNYKYYLHSQTGETQWAEEEESPGLTVWEELIDPITGEHYYFSNVKKHYLFPHVQDKI